MLNVLQRTPIVKELERRRQAGDPIASYYEARIRLGFPVVQEALSRVAVYFGHFTDHSITHSVRIVSNVSAIVGGHVRQLANTDLYLIVAAALVHDLGMVIAEKALDEFEDDAEFSELVRTYRPDPTSSVDQWTRKGIARGVFAEFVRRHHATRSADLVLDDAFPNELWGDDPRLRHWLGAIAAAHGGSFEEICSPEKFPPSVEAKLHDGMQETFNPRYVALCLRLGDLLDIGTARVCPLLQNLSEPLGMVSKAHWDQYADIEVRNLRAGAEITVAGTCPTQSAERVLREWVSWLEKEVAQATALQNTDGEPYRLPLGRVKYEVRPKHGNDGRPLYEFLQFRLNLDDRTVFERLFGRALYGRPEMALRELIQNAIDAQRSRLLLDPGLQARVKASGAAALSEAVAHAATSYAIRITLRSEPRDGQVATWLDIHDSGIGMTREVIQKYLLSVGRSRWGDDPATRRLGLGAATIGCFGIGFVAALMIADQIVVDTQSCLPNEAGVRCTIYSWHGYLGTEPSNRTVGTTISLRLQPTLRTLKTQQELLAAIAENVPCSDFPILVADLRVNDAPEPVEVPRLLPPGPPDTVKYDDVLPFDNGGSVFSFGRSRRSWHTWKDGLVVSPISRIPTLIQDGIAISELRPPERATPERAILSDHEVVISLCGPSRVGLNLARNLPESGSDAFWDSMAPQLWNQLAKSALTSRPARTHVGLLAEWRMLVQPSRPTILRRHATELSSSLERSSGLMLVERDDLEDLTLVDDFDLWVLPSAEHHVLSVVELSEDDERSVQDVEERYASNHLARRRIATFTSGVGRVWAQALKFYPYVAATHDASPISLSPSTGMPLERLLGFRVSRSWVALREPESAGLRLVPGHLFEGLGEIATKMGMSACDFLLFLILEADLYVPGESSQQSGVAMELIQNARAEVAIRKGRKADTPPWLIELRERVRATRSDFGMDYDLEPERELSLDDARGDGPALFYDGLDSESDEAAEFEDSPVWDDEVEERDADLDGDWDRRDNWSLGTAKDPPVDLETLTEAEHALVNRMERQIGAASLPPRFVEALLMVGIFYVGLEGVVDDCDVLPRDAERWAREAKF